MPDENDTVLIVEDEKFFLKTLSPKLKEAGLKVLEAKDGNIGLKSALKNKPDLIILDVVMPNMDGFTMLKELRENDWGATVPVAMLSNLSDPLRIVETENDENFIYLRKAKTTLEDIVSIAQNILTRLESKDSKKNIMKDLKEKLCE